MNLHMSEGECVLHLQRLFIEVVEKQTHFQDEVHVLSVYLALILRLG